ncbi:hypothetical protein RvY_19220 [Ramazzottius varieornatus]|uniref:Peptidase S1 domain-containing protein n=1 Tax=Ramazzottius varieornatus TaxID=947166 RepID=A0A1D1W8N7_RAMVA|nr:hypothetical protein RvY_19220 [Ramazzottius varieornatus]
MIRGLDGLFVQFLSFISLLFCGLSSAKLMVPADNALPLSQRSLKWSDSKVQWNEQGGKKERSAIACRDDERCVFSWACQHIAQPVRQCATPAYYKLAVCCRMDQTQLASTPSPTTTTTRLPSMTKLEGENSSTTMQSSETKYAGTTAVTVRTSGKKTEETTTMAYTPIAPAEIASSHPQTCGQAPLVAGRAGRTSRIVGGANALFGEFPFQALIIFKGMEKCGGALIAPQWVVTAGHCVASPSITADIILVRLGLWDRTKWNSLLPAVEREVSQLVRHPLYGSKRTFSHDIALLKLSKPVDYAPHIQPICLPSPGQVFEGTTGTITGWGRLAFSGGRPDIVQKANLPIITNDECVSKFAKMKTPETLTSEMICAGVDDGSRDACQGDSGGPLSEFRDGAYVLVGLVSWGYGCALPGYPGVYSRMSQFVDWIIAQTLKNE